MGIYYVTHPNIDLRATVHAPSTEKARTTFLDYLERQGMAQRNQRQYLRGNMVAEKLQYPEDVTADIHLDYTYQEEPEPSSVVQPLVETAEQPLPSGEVPPVVPPVEIGTETVLPEEKLSPIARASLGRHIGVVVGE